MDDQALAQALKIGDFAAAQCAAEEYGRDIRAQLQTAADPDRRAAIYREGLEALRNHLHLARVLRAHLAAQAQSNAGSCVYAQQQSQADRHTWKFEG